MGIVTDLIKNGGFNKPSKTVLVLSKDQQEDLRKGKSVIASDAESNRFLVKVKHLSLLKETWVTEDFDIRQVYGV